MKEIMIENKIASILDAPVPAVDLEKYRQAARLAQITSEQIDYYLSKIRDDLVVSVYRKVLDELKRE